jgi:flagellar secretion chaperone FliS
MDTYCTRTLEGASPVELVVALYDGILRFLHLAAEASEQGNVKARRAAVKRALDIIIHLQAQLRMDVGAAPAQALSEFYASVFAQILQASRFSSRHRFEHAIGCVRNVREAWKQIAQDGVQLRDWRSVNTAHSSQAVGMMAQAGASEAPRWTA